MPTTVPLEPRTALRQLLAVAILAVGAVLGVWVWFVAGAVAELTATVATLVSMPDTRAAALGPPAVLVALAAILEFGAASTLGWVLARRPQRVALAIGAWVSTLALMVASVAIEGWQLTSGGWLGLVGGVGVISSLIIAAWGVSRAAA